MRIQYCINRFTMEVKRQLDVLDRTLANRRYLSGDDYNIADIAVYPWYRGLVTKGYYIAQEFLDVKTCTHVQRCAQEIEARPAVQRGRRVNTISGPQEEQLRERRAARDIG